MSKIRIYELAKELNLSSKLVLGLANDIGVAAPNHMATIDNSEAEKIKRAIKKDPSLTKGEERPNKPVAKVAPKTEDTLQQSTADTATDTATPQQDDAKKKTAAAQTAQDSAADKKEKSRDDDKIKARSTQKSSDQKSADRAAKKADDLAQSTHKTQPPKMSAKKSAGKTATRALTTEGQAETKTAVQDKRRTSQPKKKKAKTGQDKNGQIDKTAQARSSDKNRQNKAAQTVDNLRKSAEQARKSKAARSKSSKTTDDNASTQNTKQKSKKHANSKREKNKSNKKEQHKARKPFSMQKRTKKKKSSYKKERPDEVAAPTSQEVVADDRVLLPERTTVGDFAESIDATANDVILKLMNLGVMASINQYIDYETMELIAEEYDVEVERQPEEIDEAVLDYEFDDDESDLVHRAAVVTVMGHVDHGKTSLLDAMRSTNVTDDEAGGITQHIGASEITYNDEKIVFLDTPGHEAFTSLRARGAQVTDIAILVVAADDGVMPQTIEAIDHARAADVPIIVAINKIDKPGATADRVKQELSEHGVLVEDWGGDVISVEVSAKTGKNIDTLLEMILLVAEIGEHTANPERNALGVVIEANLDKGKGPVATVLIQNGSIHIGDPFVCGTTYGRVRALINSKGKRIKQAGPSSPVEITGINEVPQAGDKFFVIDSDKEAKQIAEDRAVEMEREALERASGHVTLEDIFSQIQTGQMKELNLIVKADAHGSLEALKGSILKMNNDSDEVMINIKHANIGAITESDILLATTSNTIVLGFNVRPSSSVISLAKREGVEIKTYRIIYELLNDLEAAIKGMLDPEFKEEQLGEVEVRATFKVPNVGVIAGAYVLSGKVTRNSKVRLLRDGVIVHEGELSSLKRFKDDVKEVQAGFECGIGLDNFNDLKEGDIIEAYQIVEIPRK